MCQLQVYDFLLYFSHKQPNDGYILAETCRYHNCYSKVVHLQALFILLLCIVEVQRGYHILLALDYMFHDLSMSHFFFVPHFVVSTWCLKSTKHMGPNSDVVQ